MKPDSAQNDSAQNSAPPQATAAEQRSEGNSYLGAGLGVGAIGVAGGIIGGAVCPLCIVATPALIGAGLYKRVRARQLESKVGLKSKTQEEAGPGGTSEPSAAS